MKIERLTLLLFFLFLIPEDILLADNFPGTEDSYLATVNKYILEGIGDVEENGSGEINIGSSDLELIYDGGNQIVGLRFTDIHLPRGVQIERAYIQFSVDESNSRPTQVRFMAEAADNAAAFQEQNFDLSSRTFTQNQVVWDIAPWISEFERTTTQRSPELKEVIQEVLDREGWQNGNSLVFQISGSGHRTAISYDRDPRHAPQLVIEARIPLPIQEINSLYINELVADNNSYFDEFGDPDDWVELHNASNQPVEIGGLYLTDEISDPLKWQILSPIEIEPGGYAILWLDGEPEQGSSHASFKLSKEGEELALVQVLDGQIIILDQLTFPPLFQNVSYGRQEDGGLPWVSFSEVSPNRSNNGKGKYFDVSVNFSQPGGVYSGQVMLAMQSSLPETRIYYTTNGNPPTTRDQEYRDPIALTATTLLRARAFKPGLGGGKIHSDTYLINEKHSLPILSIQTEPENLWDDSMGIYVAGNNGIPGFCSLQPRNWNQNWERACRLHFYEPDGKEAFAVNAGMKIGGGCSRGCKMKPFNFYFRKSQYGDGKVEYPVFPQSDIQEYQRLKVRNSGNDFEQMAFRDGVIHSILYETVDLDLMAYRPVIGYLNGQYWGIYGLRELYNEDYIASHHDVDPNNLDIITNPYGGGEVHEGDRHAFNELQTFILNNDLKVASNYAYVSSQIDINEFLNYYIAQIYLANYDWPSNNLRVWRERDKGKWRWMLYDLDASTGYAFWSKSTVDHNTLAHATALDGDWWPNGSHSTLFLRKLLQNDKFRTEFVQRSSTYAELLFSLERISPITDSIKALLSPEMDRHQAQWTDRFGQYGWGLPAGGNKTKWQEYIDIFKSFFAGRASYMRSHINTKFRLSGNYKLRFNIDKGTPGKLFFHSNELRIPPQFEAEYFKGIPLTIKAVAEPGYTFLMWEETGETRPEIEYMGTEDAILTPVFIPLQPVITEIHYDPREGQAYEFLELHNPSTHELDLSGYFFSAAIEFEFPQGTLLAPGDFILLAKNKNLYETLGCKVFQWTNGDLDDRGELLELHSPDGGSADRVAYQSQYPWPEGIKGSGFSLTLKKPYLDNEKALNWTKNFVKGGSPCGKLAPGSNPELGEQFTVRVFPNPATEDLELIYASISLKPLHLEILNIAGQVLKEHDFEPSSFERKEILSLTDLPAGTYIFRFGDKQLGTQQQLIIKQ